MRILTFVVGCVLCLLVVNGVVSATSFEETVSQRQSVRSFTAADVTYPQLLSVLRAAYGYADTGRVLPRVGSDYSLAVFAVNSTACYLYNPEANSVSLHDSSVNKETIRPHVSGWPSDASVVLVVVWNQTRMNNQYFASIEAGCLTQNVYLAAITQNLGTCCVGSISAEALRNDLKLPATETPILVMPLGCLTSAYPAATPDYSEMTGNLPLVQTNNKSLAEALDGLDYAQAWSEQSLSQQEISQLLWAGYGYSTTGHRTVPSAMDIYPLVIYVSNATGTYQYIVTNHSVNLVQSGDKRSAIAGACGSQMWAAEAPVIFLVALNSAGSTGDGGALSHEWTLVDAGCVAQQVLLEASVVNLDANFVANGLETWNGSGAQALRSILNLAQAIIPLFIMPVGNRVEHIVTPSPSPTSTPSPTPTPTSTPTSTPTPTPTSTPSPTPTATSTPTSTATPTSPPTSTPTSTATPTPAPTSTPTPTTTSTPTPSPTATTHNATPEHLPTTLVAVACLASVALIGVILLIYFRKRKQQQLPA
jgi:nitroreductase